MSEGDVCQELINVDPENREFTEFCINGLMTGNRRISKCGYDRRFKESSAQYCPRTNGESSLFGAWRVPRNVVAINVKRSEWNDSRRSPSKIDDIEVKQAFAHVVKDRAKYGYTRVWARLLIVGYQVNLKRVNRMMCDERWLLFRKGQKPLYIRKHVVKVPVKESYTRWCSDGLELSCENLGRVKVAFALDCCEKEIMSWVATTKCIDSGLFGDLMM
jgi:hypothetical protein